MAKSFLCRRGPAAMTVMKDVIDDICQDVHRSEKLYGRESLETAEPLLILASLYYVVEDYENAERVFFRYAETVKVKLGPNTLEVFHCLGILTEIYFHLNRLPEAFRLIHEAKSISKKIDPCAGDPMVEALSRRAAAYTGKTDLVSRQRGFTVALLALCWCITRGWHRGSGGAQVLGGLRVIFTAHGIGGDEWEWLLKHAHLTRYDFVGLLSMVLRNADLSPVSARSWRDRKPRVYVVR